MKILFAISGIGLGHSIRCSAVVNELKDHEIIIAGFGESYNYFKDKLDTYKFHGVKAFRDSMGFSVPFIILQNLHLFYTIPQNIRRFKELIKKRDL